MTSKQISEEYNIPIAILDKMKQDSTSGTLYREYNQEIENKMCVKVIVRNGGEFEVSFFPKPKFCLKAKEKGTEITQENISNIILDLINKK